MEMKQIDKNKGKDGVVDNVICVIGASGSTTVDVSSVFDDGDTITDFYTGNKAVVADGKVTFTAGDNGVILLESNSKKPAVSANPAGGDYYKEVSEGLEVKLTVGNVDTATYSINGGEEVEYTDGDKIIIGEGAEFGEETVVVLTAVNGEETVTKTLTYTKQEPVTEFVKVHFKNSGWTNPNIYMYTGDGDSAVQLTGVWPGTAMVAETGDNEGWYSYTLDGVASAKVIFSSGSNQIPGSGQYGFDASNEVWYVNGALTSTCPDDYYLEGEYKTPTVSSDKESCTYEAKQSEGLELELSVANAEKSTYSINGGEAVEFTDGEKITIGEDDVDGTVTTVTLVAINGDKTVTQTYTYTKSIPVEKILKVHFKKDGWTNPNVYIYTGDGDSAVKLAGNWPGTAMVAETGDNEGWYSYEVEGVDSAKVIFNYGSLQTPGSGESGFQLTGEMWYVDGALTSECPEDYVKEDELKVSTNVESGEYAAETEEGLEIKLYCNNAETAKYSINGGEAVEYKNGDTIVVGKGDEAGTKTTLVLTAENSEKEVMKTYTYTKTEPVEDFIEVHFKKDGWTNPYIYIYTEDSDGVIEYVGKWPGIAMVAEDGDNEGWYTYKIEGLSNAKVIFSSGSMQTPTSGASGYDASGEMWYVDGELVSTTPSDYTN